MREEYLHESKDYRGMTIKVYHDTDPVDSPRDWDNLGTIYSNHRNYDFDGHSIDELLDEYGRFDAKYINENYIWLQVSAYEHSGLTIWVGDYHNHFDAKWDCGTFGIIAVSKEQVRKEYGWKLITKERRKTIEKRLTAEIETLDKYLTGEVYGFITVEKDEDGNEDEIDSCWGFYELDYLYEEAKSTIDNFIERREREKRKYFSKVLAKHIAIRKAQIKHHAPLYARRAFEL